MADRNHLALGFRLFSFRFIAVGRPWMDKVNGDPRGFNHAPGHGPALRADLVMAYTAMPGMATRLADSCRC